MTCVRREPRQLRRAWKEDGASRQLPAEFDPETATSSRPPALRVLKQAVARDSVLPDGTHTTRRRRPKPASRKAPRRRATSNHLPPAQNGRLSTIHRIRTNLLFFTKATHPPEVWYYRSTPYPEGAKSYNKGKPIRIGRSSSRKKTGGANADNTGRYSQRQETEKPGASASGHPRKATP